MNNPNYLKWKKTMNNLEVACVKAIPISKRKKRENRATKYKLKMYQQHQFQPRHNKISTKGKNLSHQ